MAEDRFDGLAPCPWCGGGEFRRKNVYADSPKMGGQPSLLITVELTHWCAKQDGLLRRTVQMAGKTADAVVAAWNRRAGAAETDALRAALQRVTSLPDKWKTIAYAEHNPLEERTPRDETFEECCYDLEQALAATPAPQTISLPTIRDIEAAAYRRAAAVLRDLKVKFPAASPAWDKAAETVDALAAAPESREAGAGDG